MRMTDLETKICDKFDIKYGIFTGNGTTAMYLVFRALQLQNKKVIFPAISCTNPVNAAIFAGYEVDFCDIQMNDYTMELDMLEKMLETGEYGIVVPTHIYGHRYNERKVRKICEKYNVVLFEDAAQSFYVGNADVSIMSFGHTKVCDTPLGGGIALTNNYELAEKIKHVKKTILDKKEPAKDLFEQYRFNFYKIVNESKNWEERNRKLKKLQLNSKKYFIFDFDVNEKIYDELDKIEKKVHERSEKSLLYQNNLNDKYVIKPNVSSDFRWRYTFLYKGNQQYLLQEARKKQIDISSWYYSLAGIYKGQHLKNAEQLERSVINLWVDDKHSLNKIMDDIECLNKIMEDDYEINK